MLNRPKQTTKQEILERIQQERLQRRIQIVLIEHMFREIPRPHCPATKEPAIQFPHRLPSPDRTGEKDKDPDRVVGIKRGWVDQVNDYSLDCAILRAFLAYSPCQ